MKTTKIIATAALMLLLAVQSKSQSTKPCDKWLTDFIQVNPKMNDGGRIDKYVESELQGHTSLKNATCMVGIQVSVNCLGEFSYQQMDYPNNKSLKAECAELLKTTEAIMNGIKNLSPGTIEGKKQDFIFKLVVKVKNNGKPVTEILY